MKGVRYRIRTASRQKVVMTEGREGMNGETRGEAELGVERSLWLKKVNQREGGEVGALLRSAASWTLKLVSGETREIKW